MQEEKRGMVNKKFVLLFFVITLVSVFYASFVSADVNVSIVSPNNNSFINNAAVTFFCNISAGGQGAGNLTIYIYNQTALVNQTTSNVSALLNLTSWNITLPADARYNWTCLGANFSGAINWSVTNNYTLRLDRVNPNVIFNFPNATLYKIGRNKIISINLSVTDAVAYNYTNITVYNSAGTIVNSTTNTSLNTVNISLTVPSDGNYSVFAYSYDNSTNSNITSLNVSVETVYPTYTIWDMISDSAFVNNSFTASNISFRLQVNVEPNIEGAKWAIFRSGTIPVNNTMTINNIGGGYYHFNASNVTDVFGDGASLGLEFQVNDTYNNLNRSPIYTIKIDKLFPSPISMIFPSANGQNISRRIIPINMSVNDSFLNRSVVTVYNSAGSSVNTTTNYTIDASAKTYFNSTLSVNADGVYNVSVLVYDQMQRVNSTSRMITVDTVGPVISVLSMGNNSNYFTNITNVSIKLKVQDLSLNTIWWSVSNGLWNVTYTLDDTLFYMNDTLMRAGQNNLTIWANDSFNNVTSVKISFNLTGLSGTYGIINSSNFAVNTSVTKVILPYNFTITNITLTNESKKVLLDLSQLKMDSGYISSGGSSFSLKTTDSSGINYTAAIPSGTNISSNSSWDGNFYLPTVNSSTFDSPSFSGYNTSIAKVIEVGLPTQQINFTSPVKVVLGGMAGKVGAYSIYGNSTLVLISTMCSNVSNPNATLSSSVRECYANSDDAKDLVIWTYHFTSFGAITTTANAAATTSSSSSSSSGTQNVAWLVTYPVSESQLSSGYTKSMVAKTKLSLKIGNGTHSVGIKSLTVSTALIEVSSTPQTSTFNIGDVKKFDVNADGSYDLSVTLDSISNNRANIIVKSINGDVAASSLPTSEETTQEQEPQASPPAINNSRLVLFLWILVSTAVIVTVVLIVLAVKKANKYSKKKNSWEKSFKR